MGSVQAGSGALSAVVAPIGRHFRVRFKFRIFVQLLTQIAEAVTGHVLDAGLDPEVILPPEIFLVECLVGVEQIQVVGQRFGFEFSRVNVRMRRSASGVIGDGIHNTRSERCRDPSP